MSEETQETTERPFEVFHEGHPLPTHLWRGVEKLVPIDSLKNIAKQSRTDAAQCIDLSLESSSSGTDVADVANDSPVTDNRDTLVYHTTRREMMTDVQSKYTRTPFDITRRCLFHLCYVFARRTTRRCKCHRCICSE